MPADLTRGVLMVHARYRAPGGEDVSVQTEVAVLRAAGLPVDLLDVPPVRTEGPRAALDALWNRRVAARVREAIAARRPAVVHVQNLWPGASPAVIAAATRMGVPVVATLRNARRLCPAGTLWRDDAACGRCAASPWPGIARGCWRGSRAGTLVSAMANRWHPAWDGVACFIAPSAFLRAALAPVVDSARVRVVPNRLPDLPVPEGPRSGILYAGRPVPEKGVAVLRRAVERLEVPLTVLGGATAVPPARAWAAMGRAAVVAVPSLWPEPFGRAALEGMGMGAAVVASAVGGLPEVVGNGGLLAPPGDVDAWTEVLRRALAEQPRLGALGRARARGLAGDGAAPLIAVYESALTAPLSRHHRASTAKAGSVRK